MDRLWVLAYWDNTRWSRGSLEIYGLVGSKNILIIDKVIYEKKKLKLEGLSKFVYKC